VSRRRLKLLTEVLPAPPSGSPNGDPRQRTLRRLGRLLTAAAAAAAVGGCKHNDEGGGSGYAVVDPMPPPSQCDGLAQSVHAEARFTSPTALSLTLGAPGLQGARYDKTRAPSANVSIRQTNVEETAVRLELEVPASTRSIDVVIEAICPMGNGQLRVLIAARDPNIELSPSAELEVNLSDNMY